MAIKFTDASSGAKERVAPDTASKPIQTPTEANVPDQKKFDRNEYHKQYMRNYMRRRRAASARKEPE
jgi:hypothetical protein